MSSKHCLLCGENKELIKGHIYPNFIRKWIMKKGGENIKKFIKLDDPENIKHQQNTPTSPLFCSECDNEKLSKIEGEFAKNCFAKITSGKYDPEISDLSLIRKFSASILFRLLHYIKLSKQNVFSELEKYTDAHVNKAIEEWRNVVIKENSPSCYKLYFNYLYTTDKKKSSLLWNFKPYLFYDKNIYVMAVLCGPLFIIGGLTPNITYNSGMIEGVINHLIKLCSDKTFIIGGNDIKLGDNCLFHFINEDYLLTSILS
ncbi:MULTISPECIES: hypothetical protein [unclassified Gilliamella]|uniref:hypothetical protein n=1 Tax=unclassified Gilliamella TaxID=2685620 RepID=UPI001329DDCC|nr:MULTISPECIES: hypothetical protein [unclassified Gilliamella]MWN32106.1 hypothetical protein [Gilliamella sp. Pra-s60]MWP29365.1 hypothetical protein [Gilliamella sp. Pra-s54]